MTCFLNGIIFQDQQMENLDSEKIRHLAGWGYFCAPSYMALWYSWLDTRYVATTTRYHFWWCLVLIVNNCCRVIAIKVLLDQTGLTIPLLLGFFPYMSWCQGKDDLTAELREKLAWTYFLSCCWFIPAQAVNFRFIPPKYRIIYNGVCGFVWANILCAVKRSGEMK